MNKLFLELVSPSKKLLSLEVDSVYAPGAEGDLGILPDHTHFMCSLRTGELSYTVGTKVEYVAIDGGFLKVSDNRVDVLAEAAELGKDINIDEILRRKKAAEQELEEARYKDNVSFQQAELNLKRELIYLGVANKYHHF